MFPRISVFVAFTFWLSSCHVAATPVLEERQAVQAPQLVGSTVTLDYGTFDGLRNDSTGIIYFRGVRFADAPVGDLRWRAPVVPPTKDLGKVDATKFANECIQTTQTTVTTGTSEDCLFGNVFIPLNTNVNSKLPVMVWFHGGGFQAGSTHDAPPELIMHSSATPLIFVSFEYRLGQFGFLGGQQIHDNGALNAGLLDQRAALRWVKRYIHQFGGDSSQVTIWGESAGAGSTMFQLIGNGGNDEGLFRAAMGDSPSLSFVPAFDGTYDQGIFDQFASFAGCGNKGDSTLACLRSATSQTLTSAGSQLLDARPATLFVFAPILDGEFVQDRPVEAFKSGRFSRVPVLFGSNTNEGANWSASLSDPNANTSMPNATEATVLNFLRGQYASITEASVTQAIQLYPLQDFNNSFSLQGQQMYGEARYICTAGMISGAVSSDRVSFQFHYDNSHLGSNHGAELDAFFSPPANANSDDLAMFEAMREYWTSFVTTGKPVSKNGIIWAPVSDTSTGSPRMLFHPGSLAAEKTSDVLTNRCAFWHSLSEEIQT
ncbi:alpha/beta-hydrolase [Crassisporium funariophilum]|nr:alpha/beta-hydrolase [Crassisporium funariophilum]